MFTLLLCALHTPSNVLLSACNTEMCTANAMQRAEGFVLERALICKL